MHPTFPVRKSLLALIYLSWFICGYDFSMVILHILHSFCLLNRRAVWQRRSCLVSAERGRGGSPTGRGRAGEAGEGEALPETGGGAIGEEEGLCDGYVTMVRDGSWLLCCMFFRVLASIVTSQTALQSQRREGSIRRLLNLLDADWLRLLAPFSNQSQVLLTCF